MCVHDIKKNSRQFTFRVRNSRQELVQDLKKSQPIPVSHFLINIQTLNPEVQLEFLPLYGFFLHFKICRLRRMKIKLCKGIVFSLIKA